ncbi:MAG: hypothetical protein ACRDQZ_11745 [Mycobacteriales bacterium]
MAPGAALAADFATPAVGEQPPATLAAQPSSAVAIAPVQPASSTDTNDAIAALIAREAQDEKELEAQRALIQQQAAELARTRTLLDQQQRDLDSLKLATNDLQAVRAAGMAGAAGEVQQIAANDVGGAGGQPVGEAPPTHPNAALALPLPQGINVLTPRGHFVLDTGLEYQNASSNRVVFSGIQIVNAIQIGLLQANRTSDDSGFLFNTLRYGLTNRLEVELVVPWVARADRVTTVQTVTPATDLTDTFNIRGAGLGDVEGTLRYQINAGNNGWPVFIGSFRVVSDAGKGPFDVPYNDQGVAEKLPTGSGFWVINPQLAAIYPLDPIVLFGSMGYQHSFGRNINRMFGSGQSIVDVGKVTPGDSVSAALGFAFSLNSHFSYSLGYKHTYFFPSVTEFLPTKNNVGVVRGSTLALNDWVVLAGASYRVNNHVSLNLNFEFGVTADAPNDTVTFRVPYLF